MLVHKGLHLFPVVYLQVELPIQMELRAAMEQRKSNRTFIQWNAPR